MIFSIELPMAKKKENIYWVFEEDGKGIEGEYNLVEHATMYYSDLFGPVPGNLFQIDDDIWDNVDNLDEIGNYNLCRPFL